MNEVPMRQAVPSDELPMPAATTHDAGQVRQLATVGTIAVPEYREVQVDGRAVLLTRLTTGEVIAFDGFCPHQGTSMRRATIFGGLVRCEQHKFVYDPSTGRNVMPTRDATPKAIERLKPGHLRTYPVEERDGWIWIGEQANPPPTGDEPLPEVPTSGAPPRPCAPAGPQAPAEPLEHPPEQVATVTGRELDLDLPTTYRPNHLWRVEVDGALDVIGQRLEQEPDGAHYHVDLVATAAGTHTLRCAYAKPWESEPVEIRTFIVVAEEG